MTSWFVGGWVVIVAYVVRGNYLYFAKVLQARGESVWFLPLLNRCGEITCAVAGLVVLVVLWGLLA